MDEMDRARRYAIIEFCHGLFATTNLIASDFDDLQAFEVTGRDFVQQHGGTGIHVTFSVSWHAIGKSGKRAHDALDQLFPEENSK